MFQSLHSDPEKSNMPGDAVSPSDTVSTFSTVTSPHDIEKKPLPHVIERPIERLDSNTAAIVEVEAPAKKRSHLSLFRVGPLAGLAALALALLLLFASFTILMVSDGQATDRWHEPWVPTVWLAIFTAVSNKLIAFAAIQGVVVLWWRRATRGATLKQLHTDWVRIACLASLDLELTGSRATAYTPGKLCSPVVSSIYWHLHAYVQLSLLSMVRCFNEPAVRKSYVQNVGLFQTSTDLCRRASCCPTRFQSQLVSRYYARITSILERRLGFRCESALFLRKL